jgi:hypothetical protein
MPSPTSYPVRLLVFFSLCIGFLVIGFARTPSAATSALKLQYRTGDVSPTNSDIKPDLQIVNTSTVAIPLNELTIRYWYTRDTDQSQHYTCDYAVLDCATIIATFGAVNPPVTGADHYLEIGFASTAGLLSGGSETGIIQGRITKADWSDFDETAYEHSRYELRPGITKADWSDFDETDDYSYNAVQNSLADTTTVTLYRNGRLVWGEEPGGVSTLALKLQYRAGDANPVNSDIKPELLIVNTGIREVALSDLTLRYWYTAGSNQPQYFWCDYAEVGCANVTGTFGSATPTVPGADTYLEIGFTDTAGYLPGGGGSGVIKSRITNADWRDFDETDDYSYHAEQTNLADWSRVTLYVNDVLIWGIEPGQCTGPYPAPECPTPMPTPTSDFKPAANWQVTLPIIAQTRSIDLALPPPTAAASARYIRWNWDKFDTFNLNGEERYVQIAYGRGYNAVQGAPVSNIILGFGRQLEAGRETQDGQILEDWGVQLPPDEREEVTPAMRVKDRDWVIAVAAAYIRGYNDNPNHGPTTIAIGTNNANLFWNCDNQGYVDGLWYQAGAEWRRMLDEIFVAGDKVTLASANDIEAWTEFLFSDEEDEKWAACGTGARLWYDGFEATLPDKPMRNLNFGNNAWSEYPEQWTREQVVEVFFSRDSAEAHPQIYCANWIETWIDATEDDAENIFFAGITADNAGSVRCGTQLTLPWETAWTELNNALETEEGFNDALKRSASSYYLPPFDADMP